jgi:hypothetical protein
MLPREWMRRVLEELPRRISAWSQAAYGKELFDLTDEEERHILDCACHQYPDLIQDDWFVNALCDVFERESRKGYARTSSIDRPPPRSHRLR